MRTFLLTFCLLCLLSLVSQAQTTTAATVSIIPTVIHPPKMTTEAPVFSPARFPGGQQALLAQLQSKLTYPQIAQEYSVEGIVVVRVELDAQGAVHRQQVVKRLGFGCDEAAVIAIQQLPNWLPAKLGHQAKSGVVYVPLKFRLR